MTIIPPDQGKQQSDESFSIAHLDLIDSFGRFALTSAVHHYKRASGQQSNNNRNLRSGNVLRWS